MKIYIGKNSGFCFGVKRAVETAFSLKNSNTYILGEIIHNETVCNKLKESGITTVNDINDIPFDIDNCNVIIRTHGEPLETFNKLVDKNYNVLDCTCPFVKDIQNIVNKHYKDGYTIAIIGNAKHPEVIGINGWCGNTGIVVQNVEQLNAINAEKLCVVVQTTFSEEKFEEIIKNFNSNNVKIVDIFKTICYTTTRRQNEAEILSKTCDAVLVIGGANSNNTQELFDICSKNCKHSYRLIDVKNFDYKKIKNIKKLGIVLGASTPIEQFQEVVQIMEKVTEEIVTTEVIGSEIKEEKQENNDVVSSKSEMELAFANIKPSRDFKIGQVVTAKISSARENGLTLSIKNAKKDDFELPQEEMLNPYNYEDYKDKIGESIRVMVVAKQPLKFSEKAMEKLMKEEAEIEEIKNGKIFEATISSTNKGGLIGKYGSYQVFVPASQIKLGFVKDLEKYVGKKLRLKAEKVESRGSRRQIVGSQKVIFEAEKQERDAIKAQKEAEFFDNIQEGDVVLGTPVRFTNFGAFVSVNEFDCLAHISDLSWTSCNDCSEVLTLGNTYEFKILKIDAENKRVSVGYKQLQPKPWETVSERYNVGDIIKGKVVRLVNFGAFVEVEKGIDGLVHVSQISNEWLENPVSALQVGQEIDAKILGIDVEKEKMTLSIKALLPEVEKPAKEEKEDAKAKKNAKKEEPEEVELREWKDDDSASVSIADIINKN